MTTTKPIRVMIVDDHAIVRDGLQEVLKQAGDMTVVGQAVDGVEALRVAREVAPDVVVMDLIMPNKDGVEACSEIMEALPRTRVLVLTAATADEAIMNALAAGATGYLQKYSGRDDLLAAVRDAAAGRSRIPVDMVRRALDSVREAPVRSGDSPAAVLTARERDVLTLFAQGNSYAQVAEVIGNSPITVRNTIYRIEQKLGVATKQEIVVWAVRHGLLDKDEDSSQPV
ncbi:MAG: response regulator transcription factor [Chloroflexota bacterium]|nr:response regulator transcription factor [Chloroflexota bacterium]